MPKPETIKQIPMQSAAVHPVGRIVIECGVLVDPAGRPVRNVIKMTGDGFTDDAAGFLAEVGFLTIATAECANAAVNRATEKVDGEESTTPRIAIARAGAFPN